MASSSAHPTFPQRSFNANLGKLPDRSLGGAFAASTAAQQREAQRLERERDRLEKERLDRENQDPMSQLTEEQREEINEAVRSTIKILHGFALISNRAVRAFRSGQRQTN